MITRIFKRLFYCSFNVHSRSRRHVKVDSNSTTSQCRYCGTALRKRMDGKWEINRV